jgi:hypothetical protein
MATPPEDEQLKRGPFAFYPPILNVEYNEWRFRKGSSSEILVTNMRNDVEVWVPRRLVGAMSSGFGPLPIVDLLEEMEYASGALRPRHKRVIEMPGKPGTDE